MSDDQGDTSDENFGFVAGGQAIDSLRKSGYKNVAYALGELVDNSIQENAREVDIIVAESQQPVGNQLRWRVQEIAVLDNGNGMDKLRLRRSLRLGDGDAQRNRARGREDRQMGKFGVGLPQASISQCQRVEVWSWVEGGHSNALWTYIDLSETEWISGFTVPEPIPKKIPNKWLKGSNIWSDNGTLVVWSKLDRCNWRTSSAIHNNSEFLIGRMYRNHISNGDVRIYLTAIDNNPPNKMRVSNGQPMQWEFRANDPLYLDPSAEAGNPPVKPSFTPVGSAEVMEFEVENQSTGEVTNEKVTLTFSMAKKETRAGHGFDPDTSMQAHGGGQAHGRHAVKNMGLSIVREGRELELDDGWAFGKNVAYERWWGAEIDFGRGLDEIFDVTNNKQHAQNLNDVSKKTWDYWKESDDETELEIKERLKEEDYPTYVCMVVADRVRGNLKIIRDQLEKTSIVKKATRAKRHKIAEEQATKAIEKRKKDGMIGKSDKEESLEDADKKKKLKEALSKEGIDEDLIEHISGQIVNLGYKVVFADRKMDSDAFFSVEKEVGSLIVYLNENHGAHKYLFSALDDLELKSAELSEDQLRQKARQATAAIKLLLAAWARYEDEAGDAQLPLIQRFRRDWGRFSGDFLMLPSDEFDEE